MRGVPQRSWVAWLADALDLGLVNLAADGELAAGVRCEQLPRVGDGHALAVLYVGANDARRADWDRAAFGTDVRAILAGLAQRAHTVLVVAGPTDLGRPPAGEKATVANAVVREEGARAGALLADLGDWPRGARGRIRELVWPDHVHPTPLGQLAIADAAARALGAPRLPSAGVVVDRSPAASVRWWAHLARAEVHDRWRRVREALRPSG